MSLHNNLKHKETLDYNKILFVNIISILMGFAGGLLIYILSVFLKNIWNTENIGWVFLTANILLLIILLNFHKITHNIDKMTIFQFLLISKISTIFALTLSLSAYIQTILLALYIIFEALSWVLLKMILESYAIDKKTGRIYGFNVMITNIGFALAPIVAMQLLVNNGFYGVFYFSIVLNSLIFLITFLNVSKSKIKGEIDKTLQTGNIFRRLQFRDDIKKIFLVSIALEFFFAIMAIYTPIFLIDMGFSWKELGLIFTVMLIPFVTIQYPIGLLADKKLGEKELLLFSFVVIVITSVLLYFYENTNTTLITIMIILLISRIGASAIDILRLSYFYKRIDKTNLDMIAIFQSARPIAYILAPGLASLLLIFFPLKSVFILLAIISLLILYPIYTLEDNKSESEIVA